MLANRVYAELQQNLPRIAELLDTTTDKLEITTCLDIQNNRNPWRDRYTAAYGLDENLPPIIWEKKAQSHESNKGAGIFLMESFFNEDLKYVFYHTLQGSRYFHCWILVKGTKYIIQRNRIRANNLYLNKTPVPLYIEDELLSYIKSNTIDFIKNKRHYNKYNTTVTRGIILYGKPGNGKTQICRYLRHLCNSSASIAYRNITSTVIESSIADNSLDNLFNQKNSLLFFDDIDINYFNRKGIEGKKACAILSAMDGLHLKTTCCRIFTTNEDVEDFDTAFYRPGRIDIALEIKPPNRDLRSRFIMDWYKDIVENIDVDWAVKHTEGFSFADLEGLKSNLVILHEAKGKWDLQTALDTVLANKSNSGVKVGF